MNNGLTRGFWTVLEELLEGLEGLLGKLATSTTVHVSEVDVERYFANDPEWRACPLPHAWSEWMFTTLGLDPRLSGDFRWTVERLPDGRLSFKRRTTSRS